MNISLRPFFAVCCWLLLVGCQSNRPAFQWHASALLVQPVSEIETLATAVILPTDEPLQPEKPIIRTAANSLPQVKPLLQRLQTKPNATTYQISNRVALPLLKKNKVVRKIKDVKDGPMEGPLYTWSGIVLALGMATLLAALVLALTGTAGASLVALIGGGVFVAGSIMALLVLLMV